MPMPMRRATIYISLDTSSIDTSLYSTSIYRYIVVWGELMRALGEGGREWLVLRERVVTA